MEGVEMIMVNKDHRWCRKCYKEFSEWYDNYTPELPIEQTRSEQR